MNKNVKKFFSVFLCVIMIFSLFTVTSFAEDAPKTTIEAEIFDGIIQSDTVFMITVFLKNVTSLSYVDYDIRFDDDYLEFIRYEEDAYAPGVSNFNYWGDGHAQVQLTCIDSDFSGSSQIIYLFFKANSKGEHAINLNINSWVGENQPSDATFLFNVSDSNDKTENIGFTYKVVDNGIIITSTDENTKGDIVIPSEINGLPVIAIGKEEFYGFRGDITSVTIPETVTDIDISTFTTCSALEKFIVDENNQYYSSDEHGALFNKDKSSFLQYPMGNSATEYKIPDSVTTVCESAFARAKNLTFVTIPDSVVTIEPAAFLATWNLKGIIVPDSVTELCGNAFSNSGIKFAVIPESIAVLNTRVFDKCTGLESVVIPASITHIDDFAFSMCDKLKNVYFVGSLEEWNNITVSDVENSALTEAHIYFNYDGVVMYDVNGDFTVTASDARLALRASAELETLEGDRFAAADVDKNGEITASDARTILRKSAGLD